MIKFIHLKLICVKDQQSVFLDNRLNLNLFNQFIHYIKFCEKSNGLYIVTMSYLLFRESLIVKFML